MISAPAEVGRSQRAGEMANWERETSLTGFDKRHSIHYRCEEWIGRFLELLKDAGNQLEYNEVKNWTKMMKK